MSALMPEFSFAQPRGIGEAIAARRKHPESRFIAGGTDLLIDLRHGLSSPVLLIDLSGIDELAEIEIRDHGVRIGAGVTIAALARNPLIAAHHRAVTQAAEAIAGPGHRAIGTVGGNLCLETRCIYYNQSEWWRRANGFCLKKHGVICHVAPQGRAATPPSPAILRRLCSRSGRRSRLPEHNSAGGFRSTTFMSMTASPISRLPRTSSLWPCICRWTRRLQIMPRCAYAAPSTIPWPGWRSP